MKFTSSNLKYFEDNKKDIKNGEILLLKILVKEYNINNMI